MQIWLIKPRSLPTGAGISDPLRGPFLPQSEPAIRKRAQEKTGLSGWDDRKELVVAVAAAAQFADYVAYEIFGVAE